MGSSVEQIDKTYGHLLPDSGEYLRGLLDSFDAASPEEAAFSADATNSLSIRRQ